MSTNDNKTRYGRSIKKPERWEPQEECVDDFGIDEYDSDHDGSDVSSVVSYDSGEEMSDDEDDGSDLDDFIVDDDCED